MKSHTIYTYRIKTGVVVTTTPPSEDTEHTLSTRLVADDNKSLKNKTTGETLQVIDTDDINEWIEVDKVNEEDLSEDGDLYEEFLLSKGIPIA